MSERRRTATGRRRRGGRTGAVVRAHAVAIVLAAAGWSTGWFLRLDWDPEMRLWKAFGDGAFVLLLAAVLIGPLARVWRPMRRVVPLRRAAGFWFAVMALVHAVLILNGWVRWELLRFSGSCDLPGGA